MELDKNLITRFALVDTTLRALDSEMAIIQQQAGALNTERNEANAELAALYKEAGLDIKLHLVVANKTTREKGTGASIAFGKIIVKATGAEYEPPTKTELALEDTKKKEADDALKVIRDLKAEADAKATANGAGVAGVG